MAEVPLTVSAISRELSEEVGIVSSWARAWKCCLPGRSKRKVQISDKLRPMQDCRCDALGWVVGREVERRETECQVRKQETREVERCLCVCG